MNSSIKSYLHSFKLNSIFFKTLAIELISILLITLLFFGFAQVLNAQAYTISDGKNVEQLQASLLAGSIEINKEFLSTIRVFVLTFMIGGTLLLIGSLFLFSYSRYLLNKILTRTKEKRKYWRWNALTITLSFVAILYALFFILLKLLLAVLVSTSPQLFIILNNILTAIAIITFLTFAFVTEHVFLEKYRVFESLSAAFRQIRHHFLKYVVILLFSILTIALISVLLYLIEEPYVYLQTPLLIINSILFIIYINWLRNYTHSLN